MGPMKPRQPAVTAMVPSPTGRQVLADEETIYKSLRLKRFFICKPLMIEI